MDATSRAHTQLKTQGLSVCGLRRKEPLEAKAGLEGVDVRLRDLQAWLEQELLQLGQAQHERVRKLRENHLAEVPRRDRAPCTLLHGRGPLAQASITPISPRTANHQDAGAGTSEAGCGAEKPQGDTADVGRHPLPKGTPPLRHRTPHEN